MTLQCQWKHHSTCAHSCCVLCTVGCSSSAHNNMFQDAYVIAHRIIEASACWVDD